MKKMIFTCLVFLSSVALQVFAQGVDERFVFVDDNLVTIAHGATLTRDAIQVDATGNQMINSGVSVKNNGASPSDYLKVKYAVTRLDNGCYQICFPTTCNTRDITGTFETAAGQLLGTVQDLQSEWFPDADGECVVSLSIEVLSKSAGFPPSYKHVADGPSITLRFVKGSSSTPVKGDVNGDGEVGIGDVNALVDMILTDAPYQTAADVNGDGELGVSDVNDVVNLILNN